MVKTSQQLSKSPDTSTSDEENMLTISASIYPLPNHDSFDELEQCNYYFSRLHLIHSFYEKRLTREKRAKAQIEEKYQIDMKAIKDEVNRLTSIIMSSKTNYLGDLLVAENHRKFQQDRCLKAQHCLRELSEMLDAIVATIQRKRYLIDKLVDDVDEIANTPTTYFAAAIENGDPKHISEVVSGSASDQDKRLVATNNTADTTTGASVQPCSVVEDEQSAGGKPSEEEKQNEPNSDDNNSNQENEPQRLKTHKKKRLLKRYPCEICTKLFNKFKSHKEHLKTAHGKISKNTLVVLRRLNKLKSLQSTEQLNVSVPVERNELTKRIVQKVRIQPDLVQRKRKRVVPFAELMPSSTPNQLIKKRYVLNPKYVEIV